MTPHRFFYSRLVIDFYHTMTTQGERHPTAIHFTIDGRRGILRAADIEASNRDAFCGPCAMVQSVSSSTCCLEAGRHPRGPILRF